MNEEISQRQADRLPRPAEPIALSAVIPIYKAEKLLPELYRRVSEALGATGLCYEIVFVEDCGGDASWQMVRDMVARDPRVTAIQLARNSGQHNALLAGIRTARGELIVTFDDDLQNPPEEIPKLLAALTEDVDVVYGTPEREQHGFFRDLASRITKFVLQEAMGAETARHVSAFRLFRAHLRDAFADHRSPMVNIDVLLTWGTDRFRACVVRHHPRLEGESAYTLKKLVAHSFNMLTGFTIMPLQIASIAGFLFSLFGFSVLAYVLVRYLIDGRGVAGFPFLASIIAIFSGVQLFSIGIIGEYLARMHFRMMEKPPFQIRHFVQGGAFGKGE